MATPWSAPAWMKTNGSPIRGRLIDEPRICAAYARYFVKFGRAYQRTGVPVYAVTGGPHLGGCDTCTGVVTAGPGDSVSENAEYFTLGHLARFVRPGAERSASTSFRTTGWNGQIMDVAFRNRDGSTALVVHNENDDPRTFAVAQGVRSFDYTLPGGALATFTWPRAHALEDGRVLLDAYGNSVTGSPAADAGNAVDDDATTRWTISAAQQPGQYLEVDLGRVRTIRRIVLEHGRRQRGPSARICALHQRGRRELERHSRRCAGEGQLTTIDIAATQARLIRVVTTATAPQWWSVADLRVYRKGHGLGTR